MISISRPKFTADTYALPLCVAAAAVFSTAASLLAPARGYAAAGVLVGAVMLLALLLLWMDGFFTRPLIFAICAAGCVVVFALRLFFFRDQSGDYNSFLSHWVQFFRDNGGFAALGKPIGDYNFPYLYFLAAFSYVPMSDLFLIKLLSVVFDVLTAFYAMRLVGLLTKNMVPKLCTFFIVMLLPTVVINSSWWAQCDAIYAAFMLGALYYALAKRPCLAVIFGMLSLAFKLQAVFVLPIFAVFLITGHIKWKHLLLFPAVYMIVVLPAVIAGRPLIDAIKIYVSQTGTYSQYLAMNSPNWYMLLPSVTENVTLFSRIGLALSALYLAALLGYAWFTRAKLDTRRILLLAAAMSVGVPFLLPYMHERYFYIAEVLTVACMFGGLFGAAIPLLVQAASVICYDAYVNRTYRIDIQAATALMLCAFLYVTYKAFVKPKEMEVYDKIQRE